MNSLLSWLECCDLQSLCWIWCHLALYIVKAEQSYIHRQTGFILCLIFEMISRKPFPSHISLHVVTVSRKNLWQSLFREERTPSLIKWVVFLYLYLYKQLMFWCLNIILASQSFLFWLCMQNFLFVQSCIILLSMN